MPEVAELEVPALPGGEPATDLVPATMNQYQVDLMPLATDVEIASAWKIANAFAASRMFKDGQQATRAFAKILIGRDMGLSSSQSMMGIDLVEGNVQLRGVLLLSFIRKSRDYDYEIVEWDQDAMPVPAGATTEEIAAEDGQHCTLRFFRRDVVTGEMKACVPDITYKTKQARKLKSFSSDKTPWHTARGNMLLWRAASNGCKAHCPDIFGGLPIYTEADDFMESGPSMTAGTGSGEAQGLAMGDAVEQVLQRAEALGHAGLADRATAEMALADQPEERVAAWVAEATATLDALQAMHDLPPEEVTAEAEAASLLPEDLRREADAVDAAAERAEAEGGADEVVADLRLEAEGLRADADARETAEAEVAGDA